MLQRRPNTFAQTILSLSFFACDKAADHTFRLARYAGNKGGARQTDKKRVVWTSRSRLARAGGAGGRFVVLRSGEAYDARARDPNRRFQFEKLKQV